MCGTLEKKTQLRKLNPKVKIFYSLAYFDKHTSLANLVMSINVCTIGPSVRADMTTKLATYFTINKMLGLNMLLHVLIGLADMLTIGTMELTAAYFD